MVHPDIGARDQFIRCVGMPHMSGTILGNEEAGLNGKDHGRYNCGSDYRIARCRHNEPGKRLNYVPRRKSNAP